MSNQATNLVSHVASEIMRLVAKGDLQAGDHLAERKLGELLRVSRSPVKQALQLLSQDGSIVPAATGGYVVGADRHRPFEPHVDEDEEAYLKLAADCLEGRLSGRVSENELSRRYGLPRGRLTNLLRRISGEGWAERLPGHGWTFLALLSTADAYHQCFRFRLINEPAAILEPTFRANVPELTKCRKQQLDLIEGGAYMATTVQLFETNSHLHSVIVECSGNVFIIEALRRINRIRRLIEYERNIDRDNNVAYCKEHLLILDLILQDRRAEAADALRLHLSLVSMKKV